MQDTELKRLADFLSIAIETIDSGSNDVAIDFIEDVSKDVEKEDHAEALEDAITELSEGRNASARSTVETVSSELVQEIDEL